MTLALRDWRHCHAADIVPLVDAEARSWRDHLHWSVAESWRVIEPARQAGQLPGLVATDTAGRARGWTAFLRHQGHLQVMAVVASDAGTAGLLVDGILASAEARASRTVVICARAATPGLGDVLRDRGFDVDEYRYMEAPLARTATIGDGPVWRWDGHEEAMARLCARAYVDAPGVRAFAPGGTPDEWRGYIASLVQSAGCGWFLPEASCVVPVDPGRADGDLQAAIMLTDLGPSTAHVAQMVVDPACRRQGHGRRLLRQALASAGPHYERVTLLVSSRNAPAIDLYVSSGFRQTASFIVAAMPCGTASSVDATSRVSWPELVVGAPSGAAHSGARRR